MLHLLNEEGKVAGDGEVGVLFLKKQMAKRHLGIKSHNHKWKGLDEELPVPGKRAPNDASTSSLGRLLDNRPRLPGRRDVT